MIFGGDKIKNKCPIWNSNQKINVKLPKDAISKFDELLLINFLQLLIYLLPLQFSRFSFPSPSNSIFLAYSNKFIKKIFVRLFLIIFVGPYTKYRSDQGFNLQDVVCCLLSVVCLLSLEISRALIGRHKKCCLVISYNVSSISSP